MELSINNAGLIIVGAFLPKFFERLNLTENDSFVNFEAQNRAVFLLQYLVYNEMDFPENDFPLNKLMVGLSIEEPLMPISELTTDERAMCTSLLGGVISNWEHVRNSTPAGIQETFFQREGILEIGDATVLTVQRRGLDVLMDSIPWSISLIKFPWLEKALQVHW